PPIATSSSLLIPPPPRSSLFPYTTLFRSGDVALTLPAIRSVLDRHPEVSITLATRKAFIPFFNNIPGLTCIEADVRGRHKGIPGDRKSTRLNSSHVKISYAVFCLKKKKKA